MQLIEMGTGSLIELENKHTRADRRERMETRDMIADYQLMHEGLLASSICVDERERKDR